KVFSRFMLSKKNSALENTLLCAAISLAGSFIFFERSNSMVDAARTFVTILIFVTWAVCGFSSGKNKRIGFAIFGGAYWLVPYLYMLFYSSRDNVRGYSKWLSLLNKTADLLFNKPFEAAAEDMHTEIWMLVVTLVIVTGSAYFIGMNLHSIYESRVDISTQSTKNAGNIENDEKDNIGENSENYGNNEKYDNDYNEDSDENDGDFGYSD
ncbi:MAG: hypothetical protein ACI4J4_09185, partial [Ruminiclostridium sp.]